MTRKRFCDEVNDLWGLNIDVRFRSSLPTQVNMGDVIAQQYSGGESNVSNVGI